MTRSVHKDEDSGGALQDGLETSTSGTAAVVQVTGHNQTHLSDQSIPNFSTEPDRIDYILVWEEGPPKKQHKAWTKHKEHQKKDAEHHIWRLNFLRQLRSSGLHMEQHVVKSGKRSIHYVLLSAPWPVLCYYAEALRMKMPLQALPHQPSHWSAKLMRKLGIHNQLYEEVPDMPQDYYTCLFKVNKLSRFLGSDNPKTFFASTKRHQILYEILEKTMFGHERRGLFGIEQLLSEKVFEAAFPPHDGPFQIPPEGLAPEEMNQRQILYHYWAKWSKWMKYQPLDHVRRYFGEKIAFYFAWLGFYTVWLLPASVVGAVVFLVGCFNVNTDIPTQDICDTKRDRWMCPLCRDCPFWKLSSICEIVKTGRLFDNTGTIFFSVFMSLWAVTFLEYWKRKSATLSYRWDCSDYKDYEEPPRPQFSVMAPVMTQNPITHLEEPYFPKKNHFQRIFMASSIIFAMVIFIILLLIAIVLYRTTVAILVSKTTNIFLLKWASRIATFTSAMMNLCFIILLVKIYIPIAYALTNWEMHKTQSKFEDAFVLKVFIFQFVNIYSFPIYIAFFKGRFSGYPGNYRTFFGIRNEDCVNSGCLVELAQEMMVIMVGKQIFNNVLEILIPKLKSWKQRKKLHAKQKRKDEKTTSNILWEANYELLEYEGLFQEYLEMVIQFGFITIFVAACPLAPLFALLNNWLEIRLDAQKFVCQYRRPVAEKAQNIGIWFCLLQTLTHLAVLSNALLIAFTSDFLQRAYYQYTHSYDLHGYINFTLAQAPQAFTSKYNHTCRYQAFRGDDGQYSFTFWNLLAIRLAFVIVFEHVIFSVAWLIDAIVPDIPESVEIKVKHERYLAKQALADHEILFGTNPAKDQEPEGSEQKLFANNSSTPCTLSASSSHAQGPLLSKAPDGLQSGSRAIPRGAEARRATPAGWLVLQYRPEMQTSHPTVEGLPPTPIQAS
ncbi:anoctamin-7 [Dromiciops gliroides]|uniref:anoctamin-7 n=1 Tax=Dromiciops gliroides TaxID=33562 RepID=UPI001CC52425|nr:anoctamin-7 [Dromiciops gliroides]